MSFQDDANAIVNAMYRACTTDEQRERLEALLTSHPPLVTNTQQAFGRSVLGLYLSATHEIYLSHRLRSLPPVEALGVYLHELVHSGAFGGPALLTHDQRFCAELERVYSMFGLSLTAAGRDYCLHETPERIAERKPSLVALFAIFLPLGVTVWTQFNDMPLGTACFFMGCSLVAFVLETIRRHAA